MKNLKKDYSPLVYRLVAKIPKGKVTTYGQIAKKLKMKSARLVGQILHNNSDPVKTPCHRVVFADGKLSKSYAFGGAKKQKEKLMNEGITFVKNKIDFKTFLYSL